jgi:hypothetical protein
LQGNKLVNMFPRRQFLGKQSVARSRNSRMNVYSSVCNNQHANRLVRKLSHDLFLVWSMSFPVLSNRTVNTSTILGVFYGVRAEGLEGQWKSFAVSHSTEAVSQGHKAMEKSPGRCRLIVIKRECVTKVKINPIIRTRTHYFHHTYHPTHDNIILHQDKLVFVMFWNLPFLF